MSRIDDSHQPFKRKARTGPGPKRRPPVLNVKEWECQRGPEKYTQICTYVGPNKDRRGTKTKNKMNRAKKRKYNKLYRAWLKKHPKIGTGPARSGYRCRRTRKAKCR